MKPRQGIAIPINFLSTETFLSETEQRPTTVAGDSLRAVNEPCCFIGKQLLLKLDGLLRPVEAGKDFRLKARLKVGKQIGSSDSRKFFAQTDGLLIELRERSPFRATRRSYLHSPHCFQHRGARVYFTAKDTLGCRDDLQE